MRIKYSSVVKFLSKTPDNFITSKIKKMLILFVFSDRHNPFQTINKNYLSRKYTVNMVVDIYDYSHISQVLLSNYEADIFEYYLNNISPKDIFIDFGSNIGIHSFFVLKYLTALKVYSIEANPLLANLQRRTLDGEDFANKKDRFRLINAIISNEDTSFQIVRNNTGSGTAKSDFGKDIIDHENIVTIDAPVKSVSKLIAENDFTSPLCIKLDVQGAEYEIIKGLIDSPIASLIKFIIFEVNQTDIDDITRLISENDKMFNLATIKGNCINPKDIKQYAKRSLVLEKISTNI